MYALWVKEIMVYPVGRGPARDVQARTPVRKAVVTLKTMRPVVILANEESSEESKARQGEPAAVEWQTRPGSATRKGTTRARVGKELMEGQGLKSQPAVTGAVQLVPTGQ